VLGQDVITIAQHRDGGDTYYVADLKGNIYYVDPSSGNVTTLVGSDSGLGNVTAMKVYHSPRLVNNVDFETDDFSQLANHNGGAIVPSPALDGQFSLQLLRTSTNPVAWGEIRQPNNGYYNVPTATYSFLFRYDSQTGEGGVVNFQDGSSHYKAAIHLADDGHLRFYDANGTRVGIGMAALRQGQSYTISARIGTNADSTRTRSGRLTSMGTSI
jgi:hypothetical protein